MKCASLSIQPLLSCLAALPIPASSISCNRISVAYDSRPRPLHQEGGTSGADAVGTGWLQAIQVLLRGADAGSCVRAVVVRKKADWRARFLGSTK